MIISDTLVMIISINNNDCSNRTLLLYQLYVALMTLYIDIDCTISSPYTEEQLNHYIQTFYTEFYVFYTKFYVFYTEYYQH